MMDIEKLALQVGAYRDVPSGPLIIDNYQLKRLAILVQEEVEKIADLLEATRRLANHEDDYFLTYEGLANLVRSALEKHTANHNWNKHDQD